MRRGFADDQLNPYIAFTDVVLNLVFILVFFVASVLVVSQVGWEEISTRVPQQQVASAVQRSGMTERPRLLDRRLRNDPPGVQRWAFAGGRVRLFEAGTARLTPGGQEVLVAFARILKSNRHWRRIRVEGHTMPPRVGRESWGLSAARAAEVARVFASEGKIPANYLAVAGRGGQTPYLGDPLDPRNERVEIVLEYAQTRR